MLVEPSITKSEAMAKTTLWGAIEESWSIAQIINPKPQPNHNMNVLLTLCPLYTPGSLNESGLMAVESAYDPLQVIEQSRVANKWSTVMGVLDTVTGYAKAYGGNPHAVVVFANKGVLLGHEPTAADAALLADHQETYKHAVGEVFASLGVSHQFLTYDDLDVKFPTFVNPQAPIPQELSAFPGKPSSAMVEKISQYLHVLGTQHPGIINNKRSRDIIENIGKMQGITDKLLFWMVSGYLAFDHMIPQLVSPEGLYLAAERFEPLFRISCLTPDLNTMTRVNIKA